MSSPIEDLRFVSPKMTRKANIVDPGRPLARPPMSLQGRFPIEKHGVSLEECLASLSRRPCSTVYVSFILALSMDEYYLTTPSQSHFTHDLEYTAYINDRRPRSLAMDVQGLNIQNMDYCFGKCKDSSLAYATLSETSLRSTQQYDQADSSSQAYQSENESIYDSPMPPSPMTNRLSTGSFPSPNHYQLSPSSTGTALYYSSPKLDLDSDTPSPSDDAYSTSTLSQPGRDYPVCCLYPGCNAKPFKRRADLDRHYKHRHASESQKVSFNCDYPRCSRRRDPFHRLDHFRDHLREFHKEDIEKRGGPVNQEWFENRRVSSTWWRCSKCLHRIYIEKSGYECPDCKTPCQTKRKEARRRS
ncbi:hypothetical protein QQS21_012226 [Conoideocrella luteorostrata]|uniref:C2H2-type domain-containing protein n=1 Tax=Conoideocrella luteorostrata TaxID=1105319 RepID=A0AAJ0FMK5_9HYPO|nr:hypothetical protein QQS21_012226 [Conoideocrella luteorostrata]